MTSRVVGRSESQVCAIVTNEVPQQPAARMKIAIIGGGPAGLCTYLNLKKTLASKHIENAFDIVIYETHDPGLASHSESPNAPISGGGYGLAPTGMKSLRRLDPHLHEQIFKHGFPTPKTLMKSATGWTLGSIPFNDLSGEEPECCVMVLRETVLDVLSGSIPAHVLVKHKVVDVKDGEAGAIVTLDSGEKLEYELVIGADGIWSKARRAISGEKYGPEYKSVQIGGL